MTLRDIGIWISETRDALLRDLDIVLTASPLDWPLYVILLSAFFGFLAFGLLSLFWELTVSSWHDFWEKHFDQNGTTLTGFGRRVRLVGDILFLSSVFLLIWIVVGVIVASLAFAGQGYQDTSVAVIWAVFGIPTLAAGGFIYFVVLGRIAKAKEDRRVSSNVKQD